MSFPLTRIWGARWTDAGPVAEVRDVTTREDFDAALDAPDFRWWEILAADGKTFRLTKKDHPTVCVPGAPCEKCSVKAAWWWFESERRKKAREVVA
jgi:hypothetical protein